MEPAMRRDTLPNTTRGYPFKYPPVANTVRCMSRPTTASHLTHAELPSPAELAADCRAVGANLRLDRIAAAAAAPVPSIRFEDFPREVAKRQITVDAAAARLANALHLHLD